MGNAKYACALRVGSHLVCFALAVNRTRSVNSVTCHVASVKHTQETISVYRVCSGAFHLIGNVYF